jgi:N4-gp56 family major capsid protein
MAAPDNTTTSLTNEVAIWYDKVFLERARAMLVHQEGGQLRGIDGNVGKEAIFNRFSPIPVTTTPLSEGVNPTDTQLVSTQVTATLVEYGKSVYVSRLLSTTDIDDRDKEKIDVVGQNMGESLDAIVRNALYNGATALPSTSTDFTPALTAQSVATLKENKALMYPGTFGWLGKIQPETEYDLMQSTTWQNAAVYSNVNALYEGEVGALYGVRFLVSNQGYNVAGTPTVYSNFIHGREAFGVYDNKLDPPKLYIVTGADSGNPAERFHILSWAGQFVSVVLNATWLINVETQASIS